MTPSDIFTRAREQGVTLSVDGSNLRYKCAGKLSDELKAEFVTHKQELIAYLVATTEATLKEALVAIDTEASRALCDDVRALGLAHAQNLVVWFKEFVAFQLGRNELITNNRLLVGDGMVYTSRAFG